MQKKIPHTTNNQETRAAEKNLGQKKHWKLYFYFVHCHQIKLKDAEQDPNMHPIVKETIVVPKKISIQRVLNASCIFDVWSVEDNICIMWSQCVLLLYLCSGLLARKRGYYTDAMCQAWYMHSELCSTTIVYMQQTPLNSLANLEFTEYCVEFIKFAARSCALG